MEDQEEKKPRKGLNMTLLLRFFAGLRVNRGFRNPELLWRDVMLWSLKYSREQALILLLATFKGSRYKPLRHIVGDCLNFLARHYLFKVTVPQPLAFNIIRYLTFQFIASARDGNQDTSMSEANLFLVLSRSDDAQALSLYEVLCSSKFFLHVDTMLHFLERLMDMGKLNLSLGLLSVICNSGFDLSKDQVQMACVKILRARLDSTEPYAVQCAILTQMLEMGVRPKVHMFNVMLLNACEARDFDNAWKMYGMGQKNGLVPDGITYCTLLKGAKLSNDLNNIQLVLGEVQSNAEWFGRHFRLVNDTLNVIGFISPGDQFGAMLEFYRQHCDLRPLRELGLCGDETQTPPGANTQGIWPSKQILGQMLIAYTRRHQGSAGLINVYDRYYHFIKDNHPLIAALAGHDYVANAFIMAFGKTSTTLQHCTTVVRHMLELSSATSVEADSIQYATPTAQTWSILVAAYFANKQRLAAEKVLNMMHERGIQENQVTWNIVVSGYGALQDVHAAVDAVKRMEAAGFEVDAYTTKGLSRIWKQEHLMDALKKTMEEESIEKENAELPVTPLPQTPLPVTPLPIDDRNQEFMAWNQEFMAWDEQADDIDVSTHLTGYLSFTFPLNHATS